MKMNELSTRILKLNIRLIKALRKIPSNDETRIIKRQIIRSCTSIGANYEESQAGISRSDFGNKIRIALKETRETAYWLQLLKGLEYDKIEIESFTWLINETKELSRILGTINQKTR